MIGTTFRRVGQVGLQHFWAAEVATLQRLKAACGFDELVYLATCNRVEFVFTCPISLPIAGCRAAILQFFAAAAAPPRDLLGRALHAYAGEGAAEHLFEVASSIDSMMPGETQILGQVKAALRQAHAAGLCGAELQLVFEEAFAAAKRVRHQTRLGAGTVSVLSLAKDLLEAALQPPATLAIIGAGEMASQCGLMFDGRPQTTLLFVNRSIARATELAQQFHGKALALADFLERPPACAAIVTATAATAPFLTAPFFSRLQAQQRAPLVVDLAVERDAEPQAAASHGIELVDLDRLADMATRGQQQRQAQVAQARLVVAEALVAYRRRVADRGVAPVVRELRRRMQASIEAELQQAAAAGESDPSRLAAALVARLSHGPTVGLKRIAFEHGLEVVETFMQAALTGREPTP